MVNRMMTEFSFPQLIVVPLSCHEVDGVRKEKERKEKRIENRDFTMSGLNLQHKDTNEKETR